MPIPHSPRAPVNSFHPEPPGYCDRCGFKYPLARLSEEWIWAGPSMVNTHLMVCRTCEDKPQEQFRTIVIGPDPVPPRNPRPGFGTTQMGGVVEQFVLDDPNDGVLDGPEVLT
jgi:hypothetical protein